MCAADRSGGFTLLEVLVALAIAGLALVVFFRAGGDGLVAVDTATRAEEAAERAQSHLAAVGYDVALAPGESEGDDGGGYRWRLRISRAASRQAPGPSAGAMTSTLYNVEVAITWPGRDHDRAVVLKTQRLANVAAGQ
jgi:general secretion pathway protein I